MKLKTVAAVALNLLRRRTTWFLIAAAAGGFGIKTNPETLSALSAVFADLPEIPGAEVGP